MTDLSRLATLLRSRSPDSPLTRGTLANLVESVAGETLAADQLKQTAQLERMAAAFDKLAASTDEGNSIWDAARTVAYGIGGAIDAWNRRYP